MANCLTVGVSLRHRCGPIGLFALLAICGCASSLTKPLAPSPHDVLWINRVTYGVNSETLAEYESLGRVAYLNKQLTYDASLPPQIAAQIAALEISHEDVAQLLVTMDTEIRRANTM